MKRLDITTLKTVDDLDSIDYVEYNDNYCEDWVRYIVYPVSQDELDRVCKLSKNADVKLVNHMGELHFWKG